MSSHSVFSYDPICGAPGCVQPARYRIAAPWSHGASSELKNYGLACEGCRSERLELARARHGRLRLADGEAVGEVAAYPLRTRAALATPDPIHPEPSSRDDSM